MTKAKTIVHESRANVYADLELPDPDGQFLKAQIVAELYRMATERKLNQSETGVLMGISQPEVSRLFKGHFREYSVERLITFLTAFDQDVEIVARPTRPGGPRGRVVFKPASA